MNKPITLPETLQVPERLVRVVHPLAAIPEQVGPVVPAATQAVPGGSGSDSSPCKPIIQEDELVALFIKTQLTGKPIDL
jgi:hypothetical protein